MLQDSETILYQAIGTFSTIPQVSICSIDTHSYVGDSWRNSYYGNIPSQCAAFLVSGYTFTWFVENWQVNRDISDRPVLQNKKIYPAKVTGLSIPFPKDQNFSWREGLIDNGNESPYSSYFRPGFGETILPDLNRPFLQASVSARTLGFSLTEQLSPVICGPFGRLMSMAFYVDPEIAAKYDASTSKKKKKSLNSQDYEQMPTYPPYTPYVDNSGY